MKKPSIWTEEYIIGVDEAGRGPLAGPVAVGVSLIKKEHSKTIFTLLKKHGLNDSKQIKEKTRESLFELLKQLKTENKINWSVTLISAKVISNKGITFAIKDAILKSLKTLKIDAFQHLISLEMDGALKVPEGMWKKSQIIIKGDSIKPSIMIASIVAKVTRDRYMTRISKKYPLYQFDIHKGYGTKKHRDLIQKHGLSTEHRLGWYKGL